jgi:hypothetical protein
MRILNWDEVRREHQGWAAFNLALLKAIDPRLVTHRPRDPEKKRLMTELGMEMSVPDVEQKCAGKETKACKLDSSKGVEADE